MRFLKITSPFSLSQQYRGGRGTAGLWFQQTVSELCLAVSPGGKGGIHVFSQEVLW